MNRQQRRAQAAMERKSDNTLVDAMDSVGDQGWNDLENIYWECKAISVAPSQVLPLLKDPTSLSRVANPSELVQQAEVLSKDVSNYAQRLETIHSKHATINGSCSSPDELMQCLSLGEEYQSWMYSYQTVVMPVVENILSQFNNGQAVALEGDYLPSTI